MPRLACARAHPLPMVPSQLTPPGLRAVVSSRTWFGHLAEIRVPGVIALPRAMQRQRSSTLTGIHRGGKVQRLPAEKLRSSCVTDAQHPPGATQLPPTTRMRLRIGIAPCRPRQSDHANAGRTSTRLRSSGERRRGMPASIVARIMSLLAAMFTKCASVT